MSDRGDRGTGDAEVCCTEFSRVHARLMGLCGSFEMLHLEMLLETTVAEVPAADALMAAQMQRGAAELPRPEGRSHAH